MNSKADLEKKFAEYRERDIAVAQLKRERKEYKERLKLSLELEDLNPSVSLPPLSPPERGSVTLRSFLPNVISPTKRISQLDEQLTADLAEEAHRKLAKEKARFSILTATLTTLHHCCVFA